MWDVVCVLTSTEQSLARVYKSDSFSFSIYTEYTTAFPAQKS